MTSDEQRRTLMTRYLLGQVSPQEQDDIEKRYFYDDQVFEDVVAAENEMIDSYVHGRLGATEKNQFETHFLSTPERRERLSFAQSLKDYCEVPPTNGPANRAGREPWFAFSMVALSIGVTSLVVVDPGDRIFPAPRWLGVAHCPKPEVATSARNCARRPC